MFQGIHCTWRQNIRCHENYDLSLLQRMDDTCYCWACIWAVGDIVTESSGAVIVGSLYHAMKCVDKVLYHSPPHRVGNLACALIDLAETLGNVARFGFCALELMLDRYGACIYHVMTECHSCIEGRHKFLLMSVDSFPGFRSH